MRRVCSIEYEFGVWHPDGGDPFNLTNIILRNRAFSVFKSYRSHLSNGGQLYQDCGHLEAALPECSNPRDVVLYDEAIIRILRELTRGTGIKLVKNNSALSIDDTSEKVTFGSHMNFYFPLEGKDKRVVQNKIKELLVPFLATQLIYTGSGDLTNDRFFISQRARRIEKVSSNSATMDRGIFNVRNEPFSDDGIRIHLIVADANMSQYATYLKMGTISSVLSAIEFGKLPQNGIRLDDPVSALRLISANGVKQKVRGSIKGSPRRRFTPIDIQRWYLDKVRNFYAVYPEALDETTEDVLQKWEFVLNALQKDPMQLEGQLDWVMKRRLLNLTAEQDRQARETININYHDISERGVYYSLKESHGLEGVVTEDEIQPAMVTPPQDTRAKGRVRILSDFVNSGKQEIGVIWNCVSYLSKEDEGGKVRKGVYLNDPYNTYD